MLWVVAGVLLFVLFRLTRRPLPLSFGHRVLLVTAHPDDECLFFGPLLGHLAQSGSETFLLCLSTGDFDHLGTERCRELHLAARHLGLKELRILDNPVFRDNPALLWPKEEIVSAVAEAASEWKPTSIVTFDRSGVSGHLNHRSLFFGVERFSRSSGLPAFALVSQPLWRKYIGLLDLPLCLLSGQCSVVVPWNWFFAPHRAMLEHHSQLVWFRWLYMLFSSYMSVNCFVKI